MQGTCVPSLNFKWLFSIIIEDEATVGIFLLYL